VNVTADGSGTCTLTQTLTSRTLGANGGEETHALADSEMPSHGHRVPSAGGGGASQTAQAVGSSSPNYNVIIPVESTGNDAPHNIMPPYTVVNYIIKT
jgi:microcystin-dependent protein